MKEVEFLLTKRNEQYQIMEQAQKQIDEIQKTLDSTYKRIQAIDKAIKCFEVVFSEHGEPASAFVVKESKINGWKFSPTILNAKVPRSWEANMPWSEKVLFGLSQIKRGTVKTVVLELERWESEIKRERIYERVNDNISKLYRAGKIEANKKGTKNEYYIAE